MGAMGEILDVSSDGRIDQLEALRFEMKSGKSNLSSSKSGKFRKMKCMEREWEFRKKKRSVNMGARRGNLESAPSENTGLLGGITFS